LTGKRVSALSIIAEILCWVDGNQVKKESQGLKDVSVDKHRGNSLKIIWVRHCDTYVLSQHSGGWGRRIKIWGQSGLNKNNNGPNMKPRNFLKSFIIHQNIILLCFYKNPMNFHPRLLMLVQFLSWAVWSGRGLPVISPILLWLLDWWGKRD
jgi:hypothetical protein